MKVLVVDDSDLVRALVGRAVADLGHECILAAGAEQGYAAYVDAGPDMILSDWEMPGQTGIDLCRRVREAGGGRYTYFVILTSRSEDERLVEAMQAGADNFLVKPLQPDRLEAAFLAAQRVTSLHARLVRSEMRSRDLAELQGAVARIATAVVAGADPETVFADVAREAARLTEADTGSVWRFQDAEATLVGTCGNEPLSLGTAITPRFESVLGKVMAHGLSTRVEDAAGVPGARSTVGVPVHLLGEVWGAVLVTNPVQTPLGDGTQERVARFAEIVAVGVSNAEARRHLEARAVTDTLTGVANRCGFQERLSAEVGRALRHRRALSLVLFDVDRFKSINDTYGHPVGDRVLVEVSRRIAQQVRQGELVARVGGEEFAWILPESPAGGALLAAERARAAVSAQPIEGVGTVTVSAGICDLALAQWVEADLFRLADRALYYAKSHGRDLCVVYGPESREPAAPAWPQGDRAAAYAGIRALARAVDLRNTRTWRHHERVAETAVDIAARLGWELDRIGRMREAALVHDVGLAALGPEPAPDGEHARVGALVASPGLDPEQVAWIAHHHERLDGRGGPDGLAGDAIPEGARILAVAEALETLTCTPASGAPLTKDEAVTTIRRYAGTLYCPVVVGVLLGAPPAADAARTGSAAA
jgi:diguanylate cyclase (GGDEF)-like protein